MLNLSMWGMSCQLLGWKKLFGVLSNMRGHIWKDDGRRILQASQAPIYYIKNGKKNHVLEFFKTNGKIDYINLDFVHFDYVISKCINLDTCNFDEANCMGFIQW